MEKKLLFNPLSTDDVSKRRIIKGQTTNLINLNNVKYKWANKMFDIMIANHWIPDKIDMSMDLRAYERLSEHERHSYDGILSFLVFLDSLQTANLPNIAEYITAPEVAPLIQIQDFQEVIHAKSYAYVIESVIPADRREGIYEFWRESDALYERNNLITEIYERFRQDPSDANFAHVLIANYALEGLYFYNGFMFFYNLSSQGKMMNTADMIRYIQRDELTHTVLFEHIIKEIMTEYPSFFDKDMIYDFFRTAVSQEIAWSDYILNNQILGMTKDTTKAYTEYLANYRLVNIGLDPIFGNVENPYRHLDRLADEGGEGQIRGNFFEANVTAYNLADSEDWNF